MLSLADLRDIEQVKRHAWTPGEREMLCVLHRWFEPSAPTDFASIFNSIHGLGLRNHVVQQQFDNHLRLYGAKAFPEFKKVFVSTPFDDPDGVYNALRLKIGSEAQMLGIEIWRRRTDAAITWGRAAKARSENTRRYYKSLVRRASQSAKQAQPREITIKPDHNPNADVLAVHISRQPLVEIKRNTITIAATDTLSPPLRVQGASTISTYVEGSGHWSPQSSPHSWHLAFRVWDDNSGTRFDERGFVAALFARRRRNGGISRPIPIDDEYGICKVLANDHLSFQGSCSAFVSVAASVIQILKYASSMNSPKIAGASELLLWGDVPMSAILHIFPFSELEGLIQNDSHVAGLLKLHLIGPNSSIFAIHQRLRKDSSVLDPNIARAMARIARIFGLNSADITCPHITEFVTYLVDAWSITSTQLNDIHELSQLAATFATSLGPRKSKYHLQDVMAAFIKEIQDGTAKLAYARQRPARRRRRTD
ncbi:hypothetical protein K469DRAFT_653583 [Zopfia rhizophila CBS 207.26]|uniref:DUF7587 domain-containing protein n=1 Tax=Zopfia rhizophila CBS 207.26 TaxID=1314779 RepID=A0A6A6EKY0_9PEZI|nr:hypothetical protein K469DRAFT_653583 [Zopfia rhizophila CBS 207.26]